MDKTLEAPINEDLIEEAMKKFNDPDYVFVL